jgi:hypothetical protein
VDIESKQADQTVEDCMRDLVSDITFRLKITIIIIGCVKGDMINSNINYTRALKFYLDMVYK